MNVGAGGVREIDTLSDILHVGTLHVADLGLIP